ncbi:MAG: signal peptidase I [Lachnospiraceae bacterium]|nr:signal peptidase I [Lachnospiraceae bacterium]
MKKVLREILNTSLYLLGVLCLVYLVIHFVGQRTQVQGSSMEPTLSAADNLIVDKLSYRFSDPERYDIIVFLQKEETFYIKRIIGLPGETVQIDEEGNIYVNGEVIEESYGKEVIANPGRAYEPVELGQDEYFVLGDNRNNSTDSREPSVGNIRRENIIGRAWLRIWPFHKFGFVKHR